MSSAYYYFAASLPFLEFGVPSTLSLEKFLDDCERLLSSADLTELTAALQVWDDPARAGVNPMVRAWQSFVHNLRNQSAWVRATKARKDQGKYVRGSREVEIDIVEAVNQADKSQDPLSGEQLLQHLCWQRLDELARGHLFDLEFVIAQGLRLQLLERFEKEVSVKGEQVFANYQHKLSQLR